jgi:hypothetical protein
MENIKREEESKGLVAIPCTFITLPAKYCAVITSNN